MVKINKIPIFNDTILKRWSYGKLNRWRNRVINHLSELEKRYADYTSASYDINRFKSYIKSMDNILIIKNNQKTEIDNNITSDDISG